MAQSSAPRVVNLRSGGGGASRGAAAAAHEKPKEGRKTLRRLLGEFAHEKGLIVLLLAVVVVGCVCSILAPSFQATAIDSLGSDAADELFVTLVLMAAAYIVHGLCTLVQGIVAARLSQRVVGRLRENLFSKIIHLPIKYLDSNSHGDIMSRMTNDVENISNVIAQSLSSLVAGVLTLIGTVAMMFWYCWQLALLSVATVVLTLVITKFMSKAMRELYRSKQALLGELNGMVEEKVVGYRTVAAYGLEEHTTQDFAKAAQELRWTGIKADVVGGSMGPLMNCVSNLGFVIIAAFGGYFALTGLISIGVISAFIVYAKQFSRPINEIANLYAQIETAIAGAERVYEVMDEADEDKGGTATLGQAEGVVSFEHVDFSYLPGKQVLFDFSLEVPAGRKIALVGATGSGKTTVVNLLMRFYDVDAGCVRIDGTDVRDIPTRALRHTAAIVLQDTVLFSDTIRANLTYARRDATQEELDEAARQSGCLDFIERLPGGYETVLTENGASLSAGQRQLMSICRAFLANPRVLILDEATSSVDTRTEKHIQDAMVKLMHNRTSLIIAHRLSTIQDADLIVVMDAGCVVETGTHEELLARKGRYHALYMTQFAGNAT